MPRDLPGVAVSQKCPYRSRSCPVMVPNRYSETYPAPEKINLLRPYFGMLADIAKAYDEAGDGEPTSAVEFMTWVMMNLREDPYSVQAERMMDRHRRSA